MEATVLAVIALLFLIYLNFAATYNLIKSHLYSGSQIAFQFLLIWVVPLMGALLVLYFLHDIYVRSSKVSTLTGRVVDWVTMTYLFDDGAHDNGMPGSNSTESTEGGGDGGDGD